MKLFLEKKLQSVAIFKKMSLHSDCQFNFMLAIITKRNLLNELKPFPEQRFVFLPIFTRGVFLVFLLVFSAIAGLERLQLSHPLRRLWPLTVG